MGWQFIATWAEHPDNAWHWAWRRTADDAHETRASRAFASLDACIADARTHGFEDEETTPLLSSCL